MPRRRLGMACGWRSRSYQAPCKPAAGRAQPQAGGQRRGRHRTCGLLRHACVAHARGFRDHPARAPVQCLPRSRPNYRSAARFTGKSGASPQGLRRARALRCPRWDVGWRAFAKWIRSFSKWERRRLRTQPSLWARPSSVARANACWGCASAASTSRSTCARWRGSPAARWARYSANSACWCRPASSHASCVDGRSTTRRIGSVPCSRNCARSSPRRPVWWTCCATHWRPCLVGSRRRSCSGRWRATGAEPTATWISS